MAVIMGVNLYVVRVILNVLGAEDYGIYNVVAGIVTMFTFVGTSLSSGAQRFFAIDIGQKQYIKLKRTFSVTFYVYCIIGLLSVVLLESIGLWFLNTRLRIPESQISVANVVFQISIITFLINIFIIPFNAAVIAFERMSFFAYLSTAEALAKLGVAFMLVYIVANKLILYAMLLCLISFMTLVIYIWYTRHNLPGCRLERNNDLLLAISLLKYSGWNMIGTLALLFRNQGLTILLNMFFSPIASAAQTIGQQVYGAVNQFITNIYVASRPQITKHYSNSEINEMWQLIFMSGKTAYFLLLILAIPLLISIDFVLKIWLASVPEYTSMICRFLLISLIIETFTNQIFGGFQAANKLKKVQSISSSVLLLNIPIAYLMLKVDAKVIIPYVILVILSIIYSISVVYIAKLELKMPVVQYFKTLFIPSLIVLVCAPILPLILHSTLSYGWGNFFITCTVSVFSTLFFIWFFGLNKDERATIKQVIKTKIHKYEST